MLKFHQELTCDFWRVTIQNNISISSFEQNIFQNQQNHAQPISRHVDKKKNRNIPSLVFLFDCEF